MTTADRLEMICKRLKELIEDSDKKQWAIANEIGIAPSTLSNYVTGATGIPGEVIARLAIYFHVTADYLLALTDCPEKPFELSDEERRIVSKARLLNTRDRILISQVVMVLEKL